MNLELDEIRKYEIVHVMHYDKFIEPFISFCSTHFDMKNHFFFIFGEISSSYHIQERPNVLVSRKECSCIEGALNILDRMAYSAQRIFLHGLFHDVVMQFFSTRRNLLAKSAWCLWGGDLYPPTHPKHKISWDKKEIFRKIVIKNVGCIVSGIEGEFLLAKKNYNANGKFHQSLVYPNNLYIDSNNKTSVSEGINILLGNSASPENEHILAMKLIEPLWENHMTIYCPLSYGDKEYADKVKQYGEKTFGEYFIPLDKFLSKAKYDELLECIDIGIFNHARQQAVSNMISLLGLGKKVFLRNKVTTFDYFIKKGIKVFDMENLDLEPEFSENETNREAIRRSYSEEKLIDDLSLLFDCSYPLFV